jgi:hypothetical protein
MSTLARPRTLRIVGFAVAAVAVAGTAVYVTASAAGYGFNFGGPSSGVSAASDSSVQESTAGSQLCTDFLNHFAANLGSDQTKVNAAFQQAIAQTLADEVKAGKITQKQADAIKAKLAGKQPCTLGSALRPNAKAALGRYMQQILTAAATALGVTPDELKADLEKGMSLSQVAAAHNPPISEDQFRASLIAALKPQLDQAVSNGTLTATQEQKILQRLQSGPIPFWDKAPATKAAPTPSPSA